MAAVTVTVGEMRAIQAEQTQLATQLWTGLTAAIERSSEILQHGANASAEAAFDLFMAGLVKGTTHLANGQEAPEGPYQISVTAICQAPSTCPWQSSSGGSPSSIPRSRCGPCPRSA